MFIVYSLINVPSNILLYTYIYNTSSVYSLIPYYCTECNTPVYLSIYTVYMCIYYILIPFIECCCQLRMTLTLCGRGGGAGTVGGWEGVPRKQQQGMVCVAFCLLRSQIPCVLVARSIDSILLYVLVCTRTEDEGGVNSAVDR